MTSAETSPEIAFSQGKDGAIQRTLVLVLENGDEAILKEYARLKERYEEKDVVHAIKTLQDESVRVRLLALLK